MSELREKIAEMEKDIAYLIDKHFLPRINYPTIDITKTVSKTIVEHTLIQPDQAELAQYREMFEGLRVEEECKCRDIPHLNKLELEDIVAKMRCPDCQGSGKLYRPLTMDERKEMMNILIEEKQESLTFYGRVLSSGAKVFLW